MACHDVHPITIRVIDAAVDGGLGVSELLAGTVTLVAVSEVGEPLPDRDISDAIRALGGVHVGRSGDDGVIVAFRRPTDALTCAVTLQRTTGDPALLRVGVHTGELQHGAETATLDRVHRLRDMAHPRQTLLSGTTSDLVLDQLPADAWLIEIGIHPLTAQSRPERVMQLCHKDLPNDFPRPNTVRTAASQYLPAQLTSFIGRRAELSELREVVAGNRLVILTGAGGVGKTGLAVAVAAQLEGEFVDGIWYADLAPVTDSRLVPVTVARTQHLPDQPVRSTIDTLRTFIGDRRILLLLDNCEHLLDACGEFVIALLSACPHVTILATSREPLAVLGELNWTVPSLSLEDDAVDLFTDRARRARHDFGTDLDDSTIIADICRRVDGIPLAIELAAARVRALSLTDILDNLHDQFRLLAGGARTALPRHQTLRASVDWSHASLTEPEKRLFRRLGVFLGGFDLPAATAVGADADTEHDLIMDQLSQLVDKSLVVADNARGAIRYRLLETMRQYAVGKLHESGDTEAVRSRHCDHYTCRAAVLRSLTGGEPAQLMDWADSELANLRLAFATAREAGHVEKALRLASTLQPYWVTCGRLREGMTWFNGVVPDSPGLDLAPEVWVAAVVHANTLAAWLEAPTNLAQAQAALSIARSLDNPTLTAATLNLCSVLTRYDAETARLYVDEAADLARTSFHAPTLCEALLYKAISAGGMSGDPTGARAAAEECVALADRIADRFMSWSSRIWLGNALLMQGNLDDAAEVLQPLAEQRAETGQLFMSFYASVFLGRVRAYQGESDQARQYWEAAMATATAMGGFQEDTAFAMRAEAELAGGDGSAAKAASESSWQRTAPERTTFNRVLNPMPESLLACDEIVVARRWADDAVPMMHGSNKIPVLTVRAHIALAQGEVEQAARDAHDALAIAAFTGAFLRVPDAIECLARLAVGDGNHRHAARLFGFAGAIRDRKGIARFPLYRASHAAAIALVRDALGNNDFEALWAEAKDLPIEESLRYVQRRRGNRKRPISGWESLTPAEVAVVGLVVDGLSNGDIAARLLVSHRTVQTHLTHVYTKLGLTSRVQLALEGARHA